MKKFHLSLILTTFLITSSSYAENLVQNNNSETLGDLAIKIAKIKKLKNFLNREKILYNYIVNYIFLTGKTNFTINDVISYFHLDPEIGKNFKGKPLKIKIENDKIVLENLFDGSNINNLKSIIENNLDLKNTIVNLKNDKLEIFNSPNLKDFISISNKLQNEKNVYIGTKKPNNTNLTWYYPNGKGSYLVYFYDKNSQKWLPKVDFNTNNQNNTEIIVNNKNELNNYLAVPEGTVAYLKENDRIIPYIFDGKKWQKERIGAENQVSSITENNMNAILSNEKLFDTSKTGTEILVAKNIYNSELSANDGETKFIKTVIKNKTNNSKKQIEFFINESNNKAITKSFNDALKIIDKQLFNTVENEIYTKKSSKNILLKYMIVPNKGKMWVYFVPNSNELFNIQDVINKNDNFYVYVKSLNKFFKKNSYLNEIYFQSLDNEIFLTNSRKGRNVFPSQMIFENSIYLSKYNDCTSNTCFGPQKYNYFIGEKKDGLYIFYKNDYKKFKNKLSDLKSFSDFNKFNSINNIHIGLYIGNDIGDVKKGNIILKVKTNTKEQANAIYVPSKDRYYVINYIDKRIVPFNTLPKDLSIYNVRIRKHNHINAVYANNILHKILNDNTLPFNYPIIMDVKSKDASLQKKYSNIVFKCYNVNKNISVWSTNCNNIANSYLAITNGTRNNLPTPTNLDRLSVTSNKDRLFVTKSGIDFRADPYMKEWYNYQKALKIARKNEYPNDFIKKFLPINKVINGMIDSVFGSDLISSTSFNFTTTQLDYNILKIVNQVKDKCKKGLLSKDICSKVTAFDNGYCYTESKITDAKVHLYLLNKQYYDDDLFVVKRNIKFPNAYHNNYKRLILNVARMNFSSITVSAPEAEIYCSVQHPDSIRDFYYPHYQRLIELEYDIGTLKCVHNHGYIKLNKKIKLKPYDFFTIEMSDGVISRNGYPRINTESVGWTSGFYVNNKDIFNGVRSRGNGTLIYGIVFTNHHYKVEYYTADQRFICSETFTLSSNKPQKISNCLARTSRNVGYIRIIDLNDARHYSIKFPLVNVLKHPLVYGMAIPVTVTIKQYCISK